MHLAAVTIGDGAGTSPGTGRALASALTRVPLVAVGALALLAPNGYAHRAQAPTFRAGTVLVPLDVRVVDRNGKPVADLTREDFSILEDGVPQVLSLFDAYRLRPGEAGPAPQRSTQALASVEGPRRRIVFIELGRLMFHRDRFGLVKALTTFLRERLLPQDFAVVSSFGRTTDLTADHEALARVIERLAELHTWIDDDDGDGFVKGYNAMVSWPSQAPNSPVRRMLDAAFAPASSAAHVALRPEEEFAKLLDAFRQHYVQGETVTSGVKQGATLFHADTLRILGSLQYLRFLDGEKHLIYFPGIAPRSVADDRALADIANDARVAMHLIGGTSGLAINGVNLAAEMSAKNIAGWTGGTVFHHRWPHDVLARIDAVTRSGYLLAYTPARASRDERRRKVEVRVKRPSGAKVLVRGSYFLTDTPPAYEPVAFGARQHMLTVAGVPKGIDELGVKLVAKAATESTLVAEVGLDFAKVQFERRAGRHVAKLEIAVFCSDSRGRLVGQQWRTVDLNLTEGTLEKALADGFRQAVTVPVTGRVRHVKVVAYDYANSVTGSAIVELK